MIFKSLKFSLSQRKFWKTVRQKRGDWEHVKLKQTSIAISIADNIKINLRTNSALSPHIYCGAFEWAEREWLLSELKAGDVFYDIGANIGYFTLLAAQACGSNGKVVSFEPVADTFAQLSENVRINPSLRNIQLLNYAVSDSAGEQNIYIPSDGRDAWNSMAVNPGEEHAIETIRTVCPDELLNQNVIPPPSLIKLDVEGWELHALKGMKNILDLHHPMLLVEFTQSNLLAANTSSQELSDYLIGLGYSLYEYNPRFRKIDVVSDFTFEHKNLIAKKKS